MEIARRCFDAWHRDDLDAFLAEVDPEVVWHTAIEGSAEGEDTVFRGHDGVRQVWKNYRGEVFGRIEAWETELLDLGDLVLRLGRLRVTGRDQRGGDGERVRSACRDARPADRLFAGLPQPRRGPRSGRAVGVARRRRRTSEWH